MSFGPPHFKSDLHPPPSFWSTSAANQVYMGIGATAHEQHTHCDTHLATSNRRTEGRAADASTVCSEQRATIASADARRRRKKTTGAATAAAAVDGKAPADGVIGGNRRSGGSCAADGTRCHPQQPRSSADDDVVDATAAFLGGGMDGGGEPGASSAGRFSPRTVVPPPNECWGDDESALPHKPPPAVAGASWGTPTRGDDRAPACGSPTHIRRWPPRWSDTEEREEPGKEQQERAATPVGCNGVQVGHGLGDDTLQRSSSASPRRAPATPTVGGEGREGPAAALAFLEVQRTLLKQLEGLYVSIADDRRHGLVALKREESAWKASAMERARRDLRATDDVTATPPSGGCLEERARERIIEEGPGPEAMRAVGLVKVGGGADRDDEAFRSTGGGRGYGGGGWRLPTEVVEDMRRGFDLEMDKDTAEVLEQENKALLEARAGLAAREGARTKRELRALSDRLTNDGRDALASLQRELEAAEEENLSEAREQLKQGLACSLERERERLMTERELRIFDAREASGRKSAQLAANLCEQAERSSLARREEAVRLLDQAADKARAQLGALVQAQEERGLAVVRDRGTRERKAAVKRAREVGERQCLKELKYLADAASKKNEAWLRTALFDLRHLQQAQENEMDRNTETEGQRGTGTGTAPLALQLRAIEASEDCTRLGRRLVELVVQEAGIELRESNIDDPSQEHGPQTPGVAIAAADAEAEVDKNNGNSAIKRVQATTGCDRRLCRDCDRLARANVELSRLLLKTQATPPPPPPPTTATAVAPNAQGERRKMVVATTRRKTVVRTDDGAKKKKASLLATATKKQSRSPAVRLTTKTLGRRSLAGSPRK
ncbi:unnamed protein product [Pylaiella littoralis]